MQPAMERAAELGRLPMDWDTYGADPPTSLSVEAAHRLLTKVNDMWGRTFGEAVRPFVVVPLPRGGLQMEWRNDAAEIEIEISPGGHMGYLFIDKTGDERVFQEEDDVSWNDALATIERVFVLGQERGSLVAIQERRADNRRDLATALAIAQEAGAYD